MNLSGFLLKLESEASEHHHTYGILWPTEHFHDVLTFSSPRTLTHCFHRHLLDACHVPDLVLFRRDSAAQMTGIVPALLELKAP